MRRKLIAGVAAMSLATAIVYAVTTSADAEPPGPPDPAAEVPDSRTLPGKPTLSGRVLDSAGQPLAKAWIVVVAWPSQEALQAIPDGAEVPVEVVAKTRADKEGRFVLRPGKLNALRKFASRNGDINFDLRTVGAPSLVTYSFGRSLHADNGRYLLTLPGEDAREVARTNPNGDVVSEEVVDLSATASPQPGEHAEAGVVVDKEDPPVHTCGYPITVKTYDPTWELVGAVYSTVSSGFKATFTYTSGASSSFGTGLSFSGAF